MKIVRPEEVNLENYKKALIQVISSDAAANLEEAQDELSEIEVDPESFLAKQEDPKALGGDVKLPEVHSFLDYQELPAGCGMGKYAGVSTFAGKRERQNFFPTV